MRGEKANLSRLVDGIPVEIVPHRTPIDYDDFSSIDLPERGFIMEPSFVDPLLLMMYSTPGAGKTMIALRISLSAVYGMDFGPWACKTRKSVLYIDGELYPHDLVTRVNALIPRHPPDTDKKLLIFSNPLQYAINEKPLNLVNPRDRELITSWVKEYGVEFIWLDHISSLCEGVGYEEAKKEDWDPIGNWLIELRSHNVSVGMLHHAGKSGLQRGTSGREAPLDLIINLSNHSKSPGRCCVKWHYEKHRAPVKEEDKELVDDIILSLTKQADGSYDFSYTPMGEKHTGVSLCADDVEGLTTKEAMDKYNRDRKAIERARKRPVSSPYTTRRSR